MLTNRMLYLGERLIVEAVYLICRFVIFEQKLVSLCAASSFNISYVLEL